MASTIITKIVAEGVEAFTQDTQKAASVMDLLTKSYKIATESSEGMSKKQLDLQEKINSTAGILKKYQDSGRTTTAMYSGLQKQLTGLIAEYEKESKVLQGVSTERKKLTLDSSNYAKVLEQVAKGEVSAREATRTLTQEMIKLKFEGKDNTVQMQQLKAVAGELKDTVSDAAAEISQAGSDTRGLDHVLRVSNTIVAGFTLAQSATALFGDENENLQKTLVKVTSAMAALSALQQIQEELTKKDSVITMALGKAKQFLASATTEASIAVRALSAGIAALGIGAIILIIQNWEKIRTAIFGANQSLEEFEKTQERVKSLQEKQLDALERELEYRKAIGKESDITAQQKKLLLLTNQTNSLTDELKKQTAVYEDLKKKNQEYEQVVNYRTGRLDRYKKVGDQELENQRQIVIAASNAAKESVTKIVDAKDKLDDLVKKSKETVKKVKKEVQSGLSGVEVPAPELNFNVIQEPLKDVIAELKAQLEQVNKEFVDAFSRDEYDTFDGYRAKINDITKAIEILEKKLEFIKSGGGKVDIIADVKIPEDVNIFNEVDFNPDEVAKTKFQQAMGKLFDIKSYGKGFGVDVANQFIDMFSGVESSLFNIISSASDARIAILDDEKNRGVISEKKYQEEIKKEKIKQAKMAKAEAIFNIGINIAQAITKAIAQGGIAGIAIGAIMSAVGLAQLAVVASKPLPSFYKGVLRLPLGNNPKGRDTIPAMLHEGESVMTASETDKYYSQLKAMKENKFHKLYIPVEKIMSSDIPKPLNVGAFISSLNNKQSEISVMNLLKVQMFGMREEFSYIGNYIKQGNSERIRGNDRIVTTLIKKMSKNGY